MKTIHKNTLILLIISITKTISCLAQPVIKVPEACEVVLAGIGSGTTTGFGGIVGDGGIVVMPDPFDFPEEKGNFYYISNGYELIQWELFGDLSMQTETDYNEVLQPIGAINPVNIQSYNKNLRFTEMPSALQPNFDARWARSKGRIVVSYSDKRCLNKIKFDVFKRYKKDEKKNLVPPIVGPDCILPNTTYTFSVDPIASDNPNDEIGFDKYYWSGLPENYSILYNSPDNSTITVTSGASLTDFTIECCYGRANDWDGDSASPIHSTCMTKQVLGQPMEPLYSTPPPTCLNTGVASFNIVYPNVVLPQVYTWTAPNTGWTIGTPVVGATNTIVTVTTPNNNPGGLVLTISGTACNNVVIPYQVNRSFAAPLVINPTVANNTCLNSTSSGNTYSVGPNASGNTVAWTTNPASVTGVTLVNANTPTVTVNTSGAAAGSFNLVATSGTAACNGTNVTLTINVRPATPTFTTGTPNCVVKGALTPQTYTCTASANGSYVWSFPAGWNAGSFTTTTNSITVTPASATAVLNGNATVTVNGVGTCNSPISANYAINYQPITPTFGTTNCIAVGATTASVAITNVPSPFFGTYTVTSTPAGITSSGTVTGGNLSLTIPPSLAAGTYSITVTHNTTSCGSNSSTLSNVTVGGSGAAWAAGFPAYDATVGGSDVYRVNTQPAGTTYQWYHGPSTFTGISGLTLIPSPGTNPNASFSPSGNQMTLYSATVLPNPTVYCVVTPPSGCPSIISAPRGTHGLRQTNTSIKNDNILVYPNPNDGNFTIQVESFNQSATAIITDMNGKKIGTYSLTKGENKIKNKNLSSGTYLVIIEIDNSKETRQLIIK